MRIRSIIWCGGLLAIAALLMSAEPARAFYWYGWPGSKLPPDRTVVTPPHKDKPGNPPERPPVNPPNNPPVIPPGTPVPEPATALAALTGLGAMAALRAWRRRKAL
jgi:hypothetical protein